ncbi:hypothetical protein [Desulfoluna butyratoxydans]|uniref:Polymerase/histidinol phosphatase-like n=1 Tax=Desulfoluna butyratoxydans TaxID=231438 RepID=A0A4U8YHK1_9BACT|nr:hypothetical protein [Desulfoluna butyratoxydans]VFQ42740.1 polymerase/histidinol phosphatase-like [Desulfoluna butyratoxydans]
MTDKTMSSEEVGRRLFPRQGFSSEVAEGDLERFLGLVATELAPWQVEQVTRPPVVHHRQEALLAVHWHPEFVPMSLIRQRLKAAFPNIQEALIIPTQHNQMMSWGGYSGVEVDCYAKKFKSKVQLLLHFTDEKVQEAHVLKSMLELTAKYRSSQLFDFMDTIIKPREERINQAAMATGADAEVVAFTRAQVTRIQTLLDENWPKVPAISVKNKLLKNWFDTLRPEVGDLAIGRVQAYLQAVKQIVKAHFPLSYFYRASEVIEEARNLGGGVVIPHPEEFWPILLAGYDVDGIETWNPQSQRYTEFLISVVNDQNRKNAATRRKQLIFMGDDCHMGEKTKARELQDEAKASREIGYQPAWDNLDIRKKLVIHGVSRRSVIREYRERLKG